MMTVPTQETVPSLLDGSHIVFSPLSLCEVEETFIFSAFLWVWELKKRARTHPGLRVSRPTTFCIGISNEKGVSSVLLPYTVETRADP